MRSVAVALSVIVMALLGCSSQAPKGMIDTDVLIHLIRAQGLEDRVVVPYQLNAAMRDWARTTAPADLAPEARLDRLVEELLENKVMPLEYAWGYTGTAIEVFETRRANCLAFTNLFVGMARELGVPVVFLAVEEGKSYRKEGDLVVVSDHIAVGYERAGDVKIYDFSQYGSQDYSRVRRLSDLTALSMYHSNRGAEVLKDGRVQEALGWLAVAVQLDPSLATAWVNLGVAWRRSGDVARAEGSYRRAIELDPRTFSAYQNLAALLRFLGRDSEAEDMEKVLERAPNQNPYTYLTLGDISRARGRFDEARRLYRRAVQLSEDDAEPLAALGLLALETGDRRRARKLLAEAQELEPEDPRVLELADRLE